MTDRRCKRAIDEETDGVTVIMSENRDARGGSVDDFVRLPYRVPWDMDPDHRATHNKAQANTKASKADEPSEQIAIAGDVFSLGIVKETA